MFLRILLIVASLFFAAFIPEILSSREHVLWAVPYILADMFLVVVAVLYRFPILGNRRRMRNDVQIAPPATTSIPTRDFKKDLHEKDELFQMMVDISSSGFWTFDVVTGKVYWSQRAIKLLQADMDQVDDSFEVLRSNVVESDWNHFKEQLNVALETGGKFSCEVALLKSESKDSRFLVTGHVQKNDEGRPIRVIGAMNELSDKQLGEKQSYFYAYQDALTGVYNRKFFLEKLKVDVDMALQRPDYLFAVALLDIDRFGAINTSYSINVGDSVLRVVADRIKSQCRTGDTIARIGPDVFAIVLHDIQSGDGNSDVKSIVRRIHNAVKQPIQLEGRELYIGVSMAVALNREVDCVEDIMANVTASLREMKKGVNHGGIQFSCSGIREKAMKLYKLEFDIRKAIKSQEFTMFYQPIVDIEDHNRIVAFEALVRWNQASGFISPAEFIPIAEETGLIIPLGAQILMMACTQAKKWVDMGYENIQVAVNFSAKQFAMDNIVDDLKQVLLKTKLNPKNLKLEITEYTAMCEADKTVEIMRLLSGMGIRISIDDFGTGYSSLSYLKRFPIHTLKMDKSFIDHVTDDEEDASFARMVIGIARSLNLELIAEGVESIDQLDFLKREGCRLIQGYYFSKPLAPDMAEEYLKAHYN